MIAKVDKQQVAVIALAVDPTRQPGRPPRIGEAQRSAGMSSIGVHWRMGPARHCRASRVHGTEPGCLSSERQTARRHRPAVRFASPRASGYGSRCCSERPAGACVSDIFREIDEELRRDNLLKLWSRYGRYVMAVAALALLIAGGVVAWRAHQLSERRAQSARYAGAMALGSRRKDRRCRHGIRGDCPRGRRLFASRVLRGRGACWRSRATARGRSQPMTASPDASGVDSAFRDLARAAFGHAEHAQSRSARDDHPTGAADRSRQPVAADRDGADRSRGARSSATTRPRSKLYKSLADDLAAPRSVRARAAEMAAALAP